MIHVLITFTLLATLLNPNVECYASDEIFQCLFRQLIKDSSKLRKASSFERPEYIAEQLAKKYYDYSKNPAVELASPLRFKGDNPMVLTDAMGVEVGTLEYKLYGTTLFDVSMVVYANYRRQNISTLILAALLSRHPNVKRLEFFLAYTNHAEFSRNYKNGSSFESAFKATPAYKSFEELGITEIDSSRTRYVIDSEDGEASAYISLIINE